MLKIKRIILLLSIALSPLPCAASVADTLVSTGRLADLLVGEGMTHQGKPYHFGSRGPKAFDCSGFVGYVYGRFGFTLPRSSSQMALSGEPVEGSISNLQRGDLLLFTGRRINGNVGHVGIYIGPSDNPDDFVFIHAAIRGGVQVSHIKEKYYAQRFLGARRILPTFFEPKVDTVAVTPSVDVEHVTLPVRDTLMLGPDDRRLVLLSSGEWWFVASDGTLSRPGDDTMACRLVIHPDGSWDRNALSKVRIPSSSFAEPAEADTAHAEPAVDSLAAPAAAAQTDSAAVAPEPQYYTVKKGDTLSSIARRNGTTVNKLCSLNGISSKSILKIGKKLRIK